MKNILVLTTLILIQGLAPRTFAAGSCTPTEIQNLALNYYARQMVASLFSTQGIQGKKTFKAIDEMAYQNNIGIFARMSALDQNNNAIKNVKPVETMTEYIALIDETYFSSKGSPSSSSLMSKVYVEAAFKAQGIENAKGSDSFQETFRPHCESLK